MFRKGLNCGRGEARRFFRCISGKRSQPACKPGSVGPAHPCRQTDVTAIPLGRSLPTVSSNQPGWQGRKTGPSPCGLHHPYSVLLPAGLAMPLPLPAPRCALTAPFHPYPACGAVFSLWRCPWGHPRRTLSGAVSPWSPDFPPREAAAVRPAGHARIWVSRPLVNRDPREEAQERGIDNRARGLTLRLSEGRRCSRLRRQAWMRPFGRVLASEPFEPDPGHAGEGTGRLQPPLSRYSVAPERAGRLLR
ncbi:hypothetical protein SAMN05444161_8011 [Rhizobiales bacterium GAS191]|jgi:hypothetical protein|nr:hypothetical protein SAMN05519103_07303 [Rhizobiales bacterium GAS113]SED40957.1 hypothetical protein SAMN05519104_3486 [Rhizobiales bacterium GAS188]SEE94318.1 hypothetical protein SAMN05444161_8011 [Rhizobiales bacterium GAS191]